MSAGAQFVVVFLLMWAGLLWFFWRLYQFLRSHEAPRGDDGDPPPIDFGL